MLLLHGLGATKVSFLPTPNALADTRRPIAVDLPGFGDSCKPIRAVRYPQRVRRLVLLAPSLSWRRKRPWAPVLRFVAPQLGLIQLAPRQVVEAIVRRVVPGSDEEWTAAGIDEFLRSYLTARGRAAFYGAARNIYLKEPFGREGFWARLPGLETECLFVWGRKDEIVPIAFEQHVHKALPQAEHVELDCGHVPQLERPRETHDAMRRFLRTY